jgi:hypothetical protein
MAHPEATLKNGGERNYLFTDNLERKLSDKF